MTEGNIFVTHTLQGKRFDEHAVPVQVLSEMAAYRQLVLTVARALFFQRNATRRRVPKGFEDGFQLVLRTIGEGSAELALQRIDVESRPSEPQLNLLDSRAVEPDVYEAARDLISETIDAIGHERQRPTDFPESALPLFNAFGSSLRDDERIVVHIPNGGPNGRKTSYDRKTRKRLVLLREQTYEDDVDIVGAVVQFDRHKMLFELLVDNGRVQGKLDNLSEEAMAVIRTAVAAEPQANITIRVVGRGAFDHADALSRFVQIDDVTYAEDEELKEALDVGKRLEVLATLPDGWQDGRGVALNSEGLAWLTDLLSLAIDAGLPRPYLYPTLEGEVVAEWPLASAEVSVDFDLVTRSAFLVGTHLRTKAVAEARLDFARPSALDDLVEFVTHQHRVSPVAQG